MMQMDREVFDTALHECRHAAYAAHAGLQVYGVHVRAYEGYTDLSLPMVFHRLQAHWDNDPRATIAHMGSILGALIAPVAAEGKQFTGITEDTKKIGLYARAWGRITPTTPTGPRPPAWLGLLADVRAAVKAWANAPGALMAQHELAYWLGHEQDVDAEGFAWLMRQPFTAPLRQVAPRQSTAAVERPPASRATPAVVTKPKTYGVSTPRPARPAWRPISVHELPPVPVVDWRPGWPSAPFGIVASR